MNRHPTIVDKLDRMLPHGGRRDDTRMVEDLDLHPGSLGFLATDIERAWGIALSDRNIEDWKTLGDVTDAIANSLACEAA